LVNQYTRIMNNIDTTKLSDEELAFLSLRHKDVFEELVKRFQNRIYNFILRYCSGSNELAQDLAQEVFVKAYFALSQFKPERKFSTWIFTLARNHTIDESRKKKLKYTSLDEPVLEATVASKLANPHQELEQKDKEQVMKKAINKLDKPYREVIILFYLQQFSYQEIADILKKPLGTIKSQLNRAKDALKIILLEYKEALL